MPSIDFDDGGGDGDDGVNEKYVHGDAHNLELPCWNLPRKKILLSKSINEEILKM